MTQTPCCNVCRYWETDVNAEPCASCTGGITESGDFSNFSLPPEIANLDEQIREVLK